jgi:hypothetical protein
MKHIVALSLCLLSLFVDRFVYIAKADINPGDTITRDALAQAEAFLTPSIRWMVEQGMPIQVIEARRVEWPKAYKEATEKYAAQVRIAEDGGDIANYIAGCPFPAIDVNDSLAGYKVMWNHEQSPAVIDNAGTTFVSEVVDSNGESVRAYEIPWRRLMWSGRLYAEPKPVIAHNPPTRHSNLFGPISLPHDLKGLTLLFFHYIPRDMLDDTYVYSPEMRRVRRISFANRSDALGGSDFDVDSMYGFNGSIAHWTFRILAEKEILGVVHGGKYGDPSQWCAPRNGKHGILSALPCVSWEKRKVFVVEGTPTAYPREYAYSKRILYMDREFFGPIVQEMYDQKGELWKSMLPCIHYTKKPYEGYPKNPLSGGKYNYADEQGFVSNWTLVDLQNRQATIGEAPPSNQHSANWRNEWYFNEEISDNEPDAYSMNALSRGGR